MAAYESYSAAVLSENDVDPCTVQSPTDPTNRVTCTSTFRCALAPTQLVHELVVGDKSNLRSLFQTFRRGLSADPSAPCLGRRTPDGYDWLSYADVDLAAVAFGAGLLHFNLVPPVSFPHERYPLARHLRPLGVLLHNCPEWLISDIAAAAYGITVVPIYPTLGKKALQYIVQSTGICTVISSWRRDRDSLVNLVEACPTIKNVIFADRHFDVSSVDGLPRELKLYSFAGVDTAGKMAVTVKDVDLSTALVGLSDMRSAIHCIRYTSGTTGDPKGVLQTHGNYIADFAGRKHNIIDSGEADCAILPQDVYLSYLPLAHVFDHTCCTRFLAEGASIGFSSGNVKELCQDAVLLNPTMVVGVPRVYNLLLEKMATMVQDWSPFAKNVFEGALRVKESFLHQELWPPCGSLLSGASGLQQVAQQLLGNRLRFMVVGGAPLSKQTQLRIQALFDVPLVQAYGMTECLGCFGTRSTDLAPGTVGGPLPSVEFRLRSVPELNYEVTEQPATGEILVRGPTVTPGYFRNPAATETAFLPGGWFCTGDIASLGTDGRLRIADRMKALFKLSQGEYICPNRIEEVYQTAPFIYQCFIDGSSSQNHIVGVVVPDVAVLTAAGYDLTALAENGLRELLNEQIFDAAVAADLCGFERLRKYIICMTPFTEENGFLTPSFKLRRPQLRQHFKEDLQKLYCNSVPTPSVQETARTPRKLPPEISCEVDTPLSAGMTTNSTTVPLSSH